jgi:hypothetical protein
VEWLTKLASQWGALQIAREAGHTQDNLRVLAADRAAVAAHHRRTHGADYRDEDEGGVIQIGDSHAHVQSGGGGSRALAIALGLGLAALGGGLGTAGVLIASALRPAASPAAPAVEPPAVEPPRADSDTLFELRLGKD